MSEIEANNSERQNGGEKSVSPQARTLANYLELLTVGIRI